MLTTAACPVIDRRLFLHGNMEYDMKHGFLKVCAAVPEIRPGDCEYNADSIIGRIKSAYEAGARVIVLPELCITGSTCGELFLHSELLNGAQRALDRIVSACAHYDAVCAAGLPLRIDGALYDCAAVFAKGEVIGVVPKRSLTVRQKRYFSAGTSVTRFDCETYPDLTIEVCIGDDKPQTGASVVLQMKAEPETVGREAYLKAAASVMSYDGHCALVSANAGQGESTAGAVYPGRVMIYENGRELLAGDRLTYRVDFTEDIDLGFIAYERRRNGTVPADAETVGFSLMPDLTNLERKFSRLPFVPGNEDELAERCEQVLAMQMFALEKRVKHTGAKKLVIGVSGGLDSTLALIVCHSVAAAIEGTDVIAVTMPCFGTTDRTKSNAVKLCELLGVTLREVNISESVSHHFSDIGHDPELHNAAFENAQARERTQVLMDTANDVNGIVVGTGDLSELALGWATYGGDQMSMYGVNAGIPKTLMQKIVAYYAGSCAKPELAAVLRDIVDTPISPELLPGQKTEDSVGPYELHDFFLYHMIRRGSSPEKIFRIAQTAFDGVYDSETIKRWLKVFCRRFFSQQFKRSCSPDGVRIGSVSLAPGDFDMPSDICAKLWLDEAEGL